MQFCSLKSSEFVRLNKRAFLIDKNVFDESVEYAKLDQTKVKILILVKLLQGILYRSTLVETNFA